jgi:hypothetical protein
VRKVTVSKAGYDNVEDNRDLEEPVIRSRTSQGALGGEGGYDEEEDAVDGKAGGDAAGVNESEVGEYRHRRGSS